MGYLHNMGKFLSSEGGRHALSGDTLPIHASTTYHLAAAHPFFMEGSLRNPHTGEKIPGIPRGYCGEGGMGGTFLFDLFELYRLKTTPKIVHNLNVMKFGKPDHHKSGDSKCDVFRDCAAGYNTLVMDVTGEWVPVAGAIPGSKVLKLGEVREGEERAYINALDKTIALRQQRELVAAMATTHIGQRHGQVLKKLESGERRLVGQAIRAAHAHFGHSDNGIPTGVATLPFAIEKLANPTPEMAEAMNTSVEALRLRGEDVFHALSDLVEEDLKGIVDRETNISQWQDTPLLVMCIAGMTPEIAVQLALLIEFYSRSQYAIDNPRFRIHHRIDDEFYKLATVPEYVESASDDFKQTGKRGLTRTVITHSPQNLLRSSSPAAEALFRDSDVKVLYNMDLEELERHAGLLNNINEQECHIVANLRAGQRMYKIRNRPGIVVQSEAWPEERGFIETRGLYHGRDQMTAAA